MAGVIARKIGMTQVIGDKGVVTPATVLQIKPNTILQVKNQEKDNVDAIVVCENKECNGDKRKQFKVGEEAFEKGATIGVDYFEGKDTVEITGTSIGKGFQGTRVRYNFGGGRATHGGKYRNAPGSIGTRKPRRTKKGQKLPGHMGSNTHTKKGVQVLDIDKKSSLLVVKGSVPGAKGSVIYVKA